MSSKVAIVTGGSRGIGRGIALALGQAGWRIVVNYNRSRSAAQETVLAIVESGSEAVAVQADVSSESGRQALVHAAHELGTLQLLVNNAGMAPRERVSLLQMQQASYDEVMDVNLKGPFFLTQAVANAMIAQTRSSGAVDEIMPMIINIGSISAYTSSPNRGEYCISKAGMGMMTALFADALAEFGINVYEIRPGIIATDMTSGVKEKYDRLIADGITPIKRWGRPDDVARAVVAIAQGALRFSTGEIINVDGGFHMQRL